ncbi:CRISPR-associated helicase Cas3' [Thermomicrobiaceae bacterium CFH 74404]|uniref:CRISPR-associated helicase Cas3 n=1 Tax=Thermalbibacter longus TaxID=2951981 RepID=A0AA41WDQ3_9BACT|nr:CRISPR-associated helicase Cas3' [Thermalbibacter longus]MCM8748659.1 CRISPR-associated helicase Cas3' [Thermalbibacter longus]
MRVGDIPVLYAHTPNAAGHWDLLHEHLRRVAERAAEFARPFGGEAIAYLLGIFHDLGKANPAFQEYLREAAAGRQRNSVPHAKYGATLAYSALFHHGREPERWKELALPVGAHHSELACGGTYAQDLGQCLDKDTAVLEAIYGYLRVAGARGWWQLPKLDLAKLPKPNTTSRELFIRMLLSVLVDADRLDTEAHFDAARVTLRRTWPELETLWERLEAAQKRLLAEAKDSVVNRVRREVYEACLRAAEGPPGIYRLTVPTGGGKTRSGLAFGLRHALRHGLRRIVVALPYTSIIDQTATVYRQILGEDSVLEHHSDFELKARESRDEERNEAQDEAYLRWQLATENWDAPLIVTTTVQLFESLLGNRASPVRKLHNLARSVIILDEVQTLPPELLSPTLDVLRCLVEGYGVTIVLSTATQPTFEESRLLRELDGYEIREIVEGYAEHFRLLERVEYRVLHEPVSWQELADEIRWRHQVMVILNTRRDALAVLDQLDEDEDVFHLSTLLCGAHRRELLQDIEERLKGGEPVRLVSTQVVEAGVDLDFPEVWRAIGPLDRIVQAAGRCNREGKRERGQVVIFEPAEGGTPRGPYLIGLEKARFLLREHPAESLNRPDLYRLYYRLLFDAVNPDKQRIQALRSELNYPEVAEKYRLIADDTLPVLVSWGAAERRLAEWRAKPSRAAWRRLQPYLISLRRNDLERLRREGWVEPITEAMYRWCGQYHERRGIVAAVHDPSDLIV